MSHSVEKACGRCGVIFSCAQGAGCWCGEVGLTPAQRAWVSKHFDNCLCPNCLMHVKATGMEPSGDIR